MIKGHGDDAYQYPHIVSDFWLLTLSLPATTRNLRHGRWNS